MFIILIISIGFVGLFESRLFIILIISIKFVGFIRVADCLLY